MPRKVTKLEPGAKKKRTTSTARSRPRTRKPKTTFLKIDQVRLDLADAADCYATWPAPTAIIADGPYGVRGFKGDLPTTEGLAEWYAPHAAAWAKYSLPETTLWFWGTELGWAEVHPVLKLHGWEYKTCNIWDKGVAHVAGNCNGNTIRRFPVVTEVCVQYIRDVRLADANGNPQPLKRWLREEWLRTGLPLCVTNEACGVKNAATRKYFTQCHLWYFPPPEMMVRLAAYAKKHGKLTGRPYFSLDGKTPLNADQWAKLRAKWNHTHGVTNVFREPALRNSERLRGRDSKIVHTNQKPLRLIEQTVLASTDPGDIVWEPFGGLSTAAIAALRTGRKCYGAEIQRSFFEAASDRLKTEAKALKAKNVAS